MINIERFKKHFCTTELSSKEEVLQKLTWRKLDDCIKRIVVQLSLVFSTELLPAHTYRNQPPDFADQRVKEHDKLMNLKSFLITILSLIQLYTTYSQNMLYKNCVTCIVRRSHRLTLLGEKAIAQHMIIYACLRIMAPVMATSCSKEQSASCSLLRYVLLQTAVTHSTF